MARKQNFSYQKFQRENAKAMKREAKKEQRARSTDQDPEAPDDAERLEELGSDVPAGAVEEAE